MPTEQLRYSVERHQLPSQKPTKHWKTQMIESNEKTTSSSLPDDTEQVSPRPGNTPVLVAESDAFPPTSIPIPPDPDAVKTS
jgi:hypothetical protein